MLPPLLLTLACAGAGGVPPIDVLAVQQQAVSLLTTRWASVSASIGGAFSCDATEVKSSDIHGAGLFASRRIEAGEIVALHPCHRVLQTIDGGRVTAALADEDEDGPYFRPPPSLQVPAEEMQRRQTAYRVTYRHVDPRRPEVFWVDANADREDVAGWSAHRINDGASLPLGCTDEAQLIDYYAASGARRNVCRVSLCVPLVASVAIAPVDAGSELLATYGHKFWTASSVYAAGEQASDLTEAVALVSREADLWQVATDKKHAKQIATLSDLSTRTPRACGVEPTIFYVAPYLLCALCMRRSCEDKFRAFRVARARVGPPSLPHPTHCHSNAHALMVFTLGSRYSQVSPWSSL